MSTNFNIGFFRTAKSGIYNTIDEIVDLINQKKTDANLQPVAAELSALIQKIQAPLNVGRFRWLLAMYNDLQKLSVRKLDIHSIELIGEAVKASKGYFDSIFENNINFSSACLYYWVQVKKNLKEEYEVSTFFYPLYKIPDDLKSQSFKKEDLSKYVTKVADAYKSGLTLINRGDYSGIDICIKSVSDLHNINYIKSYYPLWTAVLGFFSALKIVNNKKEYLSTINNINLDIRMFGDGKSPNEDNIKNYLNIMLKNDFTSSNDEYLSDAVSFFHILDYKHYFKETSNGNFVNFNKSEAVNLINQMLHSLGEIQTGEGHKNFNDLNLKFKSIKSVFVGSSSELFDAFLEATKKVSVDKVEKVVFEEIFSTLNLLSIFLSRGMEAAIEENCLIQSKRLRTALSGDQDVLEHLKIKKIKNQNEKHLLVVDNVLAVLEKISQEIGELFKEEQNVNVEDYITHLTSSLGPLKFVKLELAEEILSKMVYDILPSLVDKNKPEEWSEFVKYNSALIIYLNAFKNGQKSENVLLRALGRKIETGYEKIADLGGFDEVKFNEGSEIKNSSVLDSNVENNEAVEPRITPEYKFSRADLHPQQELVNLEVAVQSNYDSEVDSVVDDIINKAMEKTSADLEEIEPSTSFDKSADEMLIEQNLPAPEVAEISNREVREEINEDLVRHQDFQSSELDEVNAYNQTKKHKKYNAYENVIKKQIIQMDEIKGIYFEEAVENLTDVIRMLDSYDGSQNADIRRAFHTLKGSGKVAEVYELAEAAKIVEDFMSYIKEHKYHLNEESINTVKEISQNFIDIANRLNSTGNASINFEFADELSELREAYGVHKKYNEMSSYEEEIPKRVELSSKPELTSAVSEKASYKTPNPVKSTVPEPVQSSILQDDSAEDLSAEDKLWMEAMTAVQKMGEQIGVLAQVFEKLMTLEKK